MALKSVGNGHIEFLYRTTRVAAHEAVDRLKSDAPRADRIISICSFWKNIAATADEWIDTERASERMALFDDGTLPRLSHGVCPACHAAVMAAW